MLRDLNLAAPAVVEPDEPTDSVDMPSTIPCPNCEAPVQWSAASPFRPFCSERCKMADLGDWLNENRRVPAMELDEEMIAQLEAGVPANEDDGFL